MIKKTENYRSNSDCFFDSLMMVTTREIKLKWKLRENLRNKTLDQQIEIIEKGDYGIVLDKHHPQTAVLREVVENLTNKCLIIFDVGSFKSHTIPFIPGEEIEDVVYGEYGNEFAHITVVDVWE